MASRTAYSTWAPQKPTLFDGHYLRNRSTLDIGVLGYIGIVQHKGHSPEVLSIPPGTLCIKWDNFLTVCVCVCVCFDFLVFLTYFLINLLIIIYHFTCWFHLPLPV